MPAVLTAQVSPGPAFGCTGILTASPLSAAAVILSETLYVEDVSGDRLMGGGGGPAVRNESKTG